MRFFDSIGLFYPGDIKGKNDVPEPIDYKEDRDDYYEGIDRLEGKREQENAEKHE